MKIERLDAHDRLQHLKKEQGDIIAQGCEDCLKKNSDSLLIQSRCPYVYIFAHPRSTDDGINKRMLWQPRITRPKAQTNSYLFRAKSNTDNIEICWFIPPRETWGEFKEGKVTESEHVIWSIDQFINNRERLEAPFEDDLTDQRARDIWREIAIAKKSQKRMDFMYSKLNSLEPFQPYH